MGRRGGAGLRIGARLAGGAGGRGGTWEGGAGRSSGSRRRAWLEEHVSLPELWGEGCSRHWRGLGRLEVEAAEGREQVILMGKENVALQSVLRSWAS